MTVFELMQVLSLCDPDDLVLVAIDPEGNGYHHVRGVSEYSVTEEEAESDFIEDVCFRELTDRLEGMGITEEEVLSDGVPCVVIQP